MTTTISQHTVNLRDFHLDIGQHLTAEQQILQLPKNVWPSDYWSNVFLDGIFALEEKGKNLIKGKNVLEVGVGSGTLAYIVNFFLDPESYLGLDTVQEAVNFTNKKAQDFKLNDRLTCKKSDLLDSLEKEELQNVDTIIACIPQAPRDKNEENTTAFEEGNTTKDRGSEFDKYGLGLIDEFIKQAKDKAPNADIILNLADRPGSDTLKEIFNKHGYDCEFVHDQIVPHDEYTSLKPFADAEAYHEDVNYSFYENSDGTGKKLSAKEAYERQKNKQKVYHGLHVIHLKPRLAA